MFPSPFWAAVRMVLHFELVGQKTKHVLHTQSDFGGHVSFHFCCADYGGFHDDARHGYAA
jgi:hypothetical protein